ncbi:Cyclin N-terminal domain-containing 1 [Brachionus plicatilis]|uniref:Cyclin N-terminal domain-containing 1 n=1 Tax=Brachionus plicatilis TaxID=10195 RepID=A0A3M7P448_BRAPC|nr:Cyclin N-terminal domain-containing 1 [Brachionus plicatilis]
MDQSTWPQFNLKPYCFDTEMLQEFLFSLAEKNKNSISNCVSLSGYFKESNVAAFIFEMSEKFELDNEARFLAIEIFDKFMAAHLTEIYQAIKKNKHKDWNSIIKKIKDQIVLRSLTCIQLANKFSNSKNVIKLSSIQDLLIELGYKFSFESILNSELRVLKYLDFRLNILTPYNVVETLLEILGHNLKNSQPKALYIISIRLLESFYFCKEQIYKRLYESFSGKAKDHTERQFKPQTFTNIVVIF